MRYLKYIMTVGLLLNLNSISWAQTAKKVTIIGGARSEMTAAKFDTKDSIPDTTTLRKNNGGYAIVDLGFNIKPNKHTEILGMYRISNKFGGFWGSGVSFDVRQLWIKGVVANTLRYQLGDINIKQSQLTLYNHHADQFDTLPSLFMMQNQIVSYEKFYYADNSWRMQGAHINFGIDFSRYIQSIQCNAFINRLNATNFSNIPDRLMRGTSIDFVLSPNQQLTWHNNVIFDVPGTVNTQTKFNNAINSVEYASKVKVAQQIIKLHGELAFSQYAFKGDSLSPQLNDYALRAEAQYHHKASNMDFELSYMSIGPDFRSFGAQSKDVNYSLENSVYNRYTNAQILRPIAFIDVLSQTGIYNRTISTQLMPENIIYNIALPYGAATFNRQGLGLAIKKQMPKKLFAGLKYNALSEIRGQGTLALRQFQSIQATVLKTLDFKHPIQFSVNYKYQSSQRTSNQVVESVNYHLSHTLLGVQYELMADLDLVFNYGLMMNKGEEFLADRNAYTELVYFNKINYDLKQQMSSLGLKYTFGPKAFLSTYIQQFDYMNQAVANRNYKLTQFNVLFNQLF